MGASLSRYDDLSRNPSLERFCGKEPIPPGDAFWSGFLSFNMRPPVTRNDQIELDSRLDTMCQRLLTNNPSSGNFGSLIQVTLLRTSELLASVTNQNIMSAWQTYNALFAVRCILKYLVETVGEIEMIKHAETLPNEAQNSQIMKLESLFEALIEIIIDVPLCEFTYVVHLEAVNCLLVLLSVQLFSQSSAEYSTVYRIIMNHEASMHAPVVVCTLLHNFSQQEHAPPGLLSREAGGSIVFNIAGDDDAG